MTAATTARISETSGDTQSTPEASQRAKPTSLLSQKWVDLQTRRSRTWKQPVAADSLAVFRICFGLLVVFSSLRFLWKGWVNALYLAPENHLTYRGFGWVAPLPAPWMHLIVLALAVFGVCIALGYRYRLATALFLTGFAYTELI